MNVPQNMRTLQAVGEHQFLIVQQLHRRPVSHDLSAVASLCDQALFLSRGRIVREARFSAGACRAEDLARLYDAGDAGDKAGAAP